MAAGCVELLVRLQGLLQVISLRPLIIEDGEGGLGWFCAAVPDGDERFLSTRPDAQKPCAGKSRVASFGMTRVFLRSLVAAKAATS